MARRIDRSDPDHNSSASRAQGSDTVSHAKLGQSRAIARDSSGLRVTQRGSPGHNSADRVVRHVLIGKA